MTLTAFALMWCLYFGLLGQDCQFTTVIQWTTDIYDDAIGCFPSECAETTNPHLTCELFDTYRPEVVSPNPKHEYYKQYLCKRRGAPVS